MQQRYKFDISQELVLPEFYNQHKNNLPMLIVVSGGYYGQTKYDDMSTDQVCKGERYRKYINSECTMVGKVERFRKYIDSEYTMVCKGERYHGV